MTGVYGAVARSRGVFVAMSVPESNLKGERRGHEECGPAAASLDGPGV